MDAAICISSRHRLRQQPSALLPQKNLRALADFAAKARADEVPKLSGGDVFGLKTLRALADFKFHHLALVQGLVAFHLDRGEMHENIFPGLALNEPIPLGGVEPLHYTMFSGQLRAPSNLNFAVCWDVTPVSGTTKSGASSARAHPSAAPRTQRNYTSGKSAAMLIHKGSGGKTQVKTSFPPADAGSVSP